VQTKRGTPSKVSQYGLDLVARQYDRKPPRLARSHHSLDAVQGLAQHMLVQEQQRRQGLILSGRGHVFLDGQMR